MRSRIEVYWNSIETVPAGVAVQVRVTDGSSDEYLLPYPCKLTPDGWVNAATGSPLAVRPTYWKLYVETLPRKWKRKNPAVDQLGCSRRDDGIITHEAERGVARMAKKPAHPAAGVRMIDE